MSETNNKNLFSNALRGFLWFTGATAVHSVLRLIFVATLARLLSPSDFGVMATAMLVVKFSEVILQMGVGPALVQKKDLTKKHLDSAITLTLIMGVGMYGLFLLFNPLIEEFFGMSGLKEILNLLCLIIPLRMFSQVSYSTLQRDFKFKKLAGWDVFSYAVGYGGLGILLAKLDFGVYALVYAATVQALLYTVILYFLNPHSLRFRIYKNETYELVNYGAGFTLASVFNYMGRNGDTFVVSKFLGELQLGFYDRAYTLMNVVNNVLGSTINKVMFPTFSSIQDNKGKIEQALSKSFNLSFGVLIPASFFCYMLADDIVLFLLGDKWSGSVAPFRILCFFFAFRVTGKISSVTMKGLGFIYQHAVSQFIYMGVVVLGGLMVIDSGITSMAWIVGLGITTVFLSHMLFLHIRGYKVFGKVLKGLLHAIPLSIIVIIVCWPFLKGTTLTGGTSLIRLTLSFIAVLALTSLLYLVGFRKVVSADIPLLMQKVFSTFRKKKRSE